MLQFFKTIHRISSRNSTLSIPIQIYLQSSLSSSSNEVFFTAGTFCRTTGSSAKSITLSHDSLDINDMYDLMPL